MLEDLFGCDHTPEMPIVEEYTGEILYWICRCGRMHPVPDKHASTEEKPER
jgi:hypothetical protein